MSDSNYSRLQESAIALQNAGEDEAALNAFRELEILDESQSERAITILSQVSCEIALGRYEAARENIRRAEGIAANAKNVTIQCSFYDAAVEIAMNRPKSALKTLARVLTSERATLERPEFQDLLPPVAAAARLYVS